MMRKLCLVFTLAFLVLSLGLKAQDLQLPGLEGGRLSEGDLVVMSVDREGVRDGARAVRE